ncbi:hypothetical protein ACFL27_02650 [candidate division CSSED10-310 bacterium]|uniref:ABC transporter permease n=1 Tax=candidate division CSSED10-310 bacterium TaxID=2855610 RepID=A0ABV6YSA2_UNCC1
MIRRIAAITRFELLLQRRSALFWVTISVPIILVVPLFYLHYIGIGKLLSLGFTGQEAYEVLLMAIFIVPDLSLQFYQPLWSGFCAKQAILVPGYFLIILSVLIVPGSMNRYYRYNVEETFRTKPCSAGEYILGMFIAFTAPACAALLLCGLIALGVDSILNRLYLDSYIYFIYFFFIVTSVFFVVSLVMMVSSYFQSSLLSVLIVYGLFFISALFYMLETITHESMPVTLYGLADLLNFSLLQNKYSQLNGFLYPIYPLVMKKCVQIVLIPLFLFLAVQRRTQVFFQEERDLGEDIARKIDYLRHLIHTGLKDLKRIFSIKQVNFRFVSWILLFLVLSGGLGRELWLQQDALASRERMVGYELAPLKNLAKEIPNFLIRHYELTLLELPHTGHLRVKARLDVQNRDQKAISELFFSLHPAYVIEKCEDGQGKPLKFARLQSLVKVFLSTPMLIEATGCIQFTYAYNPATIFPTAAIPNLSSLGDLPFMKKEFFLFEEDLSFYIRLGHIPKFEQNGFLDRYELWYPLAGCVGKFADMSSFHAGFSQVEIHIAHSEVQYWTVGNQVSSDEKYQTWKTDHPVSKIWLIWGDYQKTTEKMESVEIVWFHHPLHQGAFLANNTLVIDEKSAFHTNFRKARSMLPSPFKEKPAIILETDQLSLAQITNRNSGSPPFLISESFLKTRWRDVLQQGKHWLNFNDIFWDKLNQSLLNSIWDDSIKITGPGRAVLNKGLFQYVMAHSGSDWFKHGVRKLGWTDYNLWREVTVMDFNSKNEDLQSTYRDKCRQFHFTLDYLLGQEKYLNLIRTFWAEHRFQEVQFSDFLDYLKSSVDHPQLETVLDLLLYKKGLLSYGIGRSHVKRVQDRYLLTIKIKNEGEYELPVPLLVKCSGSDELRDVTVPVGGSRIYKIESFSRPVEAFLDSRGFTPNANQHTRREFIY